MHYKWRGRFKHPERREDGNLKPLTYPHVGNDLNIGRFITCSLVRKSAAANAALGNPKSYIRSFLGNSRDEGRMMNVLEGIGHDFPKGTCENMLAL